MTNSQAAYLIVGLEPSTKRSKNVRPRCKATKMQGDPLKSSISGRPKNHHQKPKCKTTKLGTSLIQKPLRPEQGP
jgi:hypothetical protein